mmetsp:Transcript_7082/g.16028  ORF Transcript_7082/g.16028 Transcript_7082/m.16028 type:complete len:180 (-) Transcript_7082:66-605(-)
MERHTPCVDNVHIISRVVASLSDIHQAFRDPSKISEIQVIQLFAMIADEMMISTAFPDGFADKFELFKVSHCLNNMWSRASMRRWRPCRFVPKILQSAMHDKAFTDEVKVEIKKARDAKHLLMKQADLCKTPEMVRQTLTTLHSFMDMACSNMPAMLRDGGTSFQELPVQERSWMPLRT